MIRVFLPFYVSYSSSQRTRRILLTRCLALCRFAVVGGDGFEWMGVLPVLLRPRCVFCPPPPPKKRRLVCLIVFFYIFEVIPGGVWRVWRRDRHGDDHDA